MSVSLKEFHISKEPHQSKSSLTASLNGVLQGGRGCNSYKDGVQSRARLKVIADADGLLADKSIEFNHRGKRFGAGGLMHV